MRIQESEGLAGQAVRAAAKGSMAGRRDPLPIERFTIDGERGAAERSRLERVQADRKSDADLVERRAEQRNLDRRAASASVSERHTERPGHVPEGRDQARSTDQGSMADLQAKADAAGLSPAKRDPVETDEEKASEAASEARSAQDTQLPAMISPPLPLGRVLAEAASSPAGRNVADTAAEAEEYEASAKPDGDDGRGREAAGQVVQGQEAHGKELATASAAPSSSERRPFPPRPAKCRRGPQMASHRRHRSGSDSMGRAVAKALRPWTWPDPVRPRSKLRRPKPPPRRPPPPNRAMAALSPTSSPVSRRRRQRTRRRQTSLPLQRRLSQPIPSHSRRRRCRCLTRAHRCRSAPFR